MRALVYSSILLFTTAGCYHAGERAGDDAVAKGEHKEATQAYARALGSGEVLSWERERIQDKLREAGDVHVRGGIAKVEQGPHASEDRVLAFSRLRAEGREAGVARRLDEEVFAKMKAEAERGMTAIRAEDSTRPYLSRVDRAERIASVFTKTEPVWTSVGELRAEAAAHHTKLAADAAQGGKDTAGSLLVHAALAQRFGGSAVPSNAEALRTARESADIVWTATAIGTSCSGQAQTIAKRFPSNDLGRPASATVRIDQCEPLSKTWDTTESYTYTQKVEYQEQERYQAGYTTQEVTDYRAEQVCTEGPPRYVGRTQVPNRECRTEQRPYKKTEQVPRYDWRTVTKSRDEQRTGSRTVNHARYGYRIRGACDVTLGSDTKTLTIDEGVDLEDTSYTSPHGSKSLAANVNAGGAEARAVEAAYERIAPARSRLAQAIGAEHEARAKQAETEGRTAVAEGAYLIATRATGSVPASGTALFRTRYGLESADVVTLAKGGSLAAPTNASSKAALEPLTTDRADIAHAYATSRGRTRGIDSFAFWMLGGATSTENILNQPNRSGAGGGIAFGIGALQHLMDDGWGLGVHDDIWLELQAGGRTSEGVTYTGGDREAKYSTQLHAAYSLLFGYRTQRFGLFGGARAAYRGLHVGDASLSGTYVPLVGRAEFRLGGPATIVLQGWGVKVAGSGEARGIMLDVPITRELFYVRAQLEQWKVEAVVLDAAKNEASAAQQVTTITTFGFGVVL